MKVIIMKRNGKTALLLGMVAREEVEIAEEPEYYEAFQEFDIDAAYGVDDLVRFCLKQAFALGMESKVD